MNYLLAELWDLSFSETIVAGGSALSMSLRKLYMYWSNQDTSNGSKFSIVIFDSISSFSK